MSAAVSAGLLPVDTVSQFQAWTACPGCHPRHHQAARYAAAGWPHHSESQEMPRAVTALPAGTAP